MEWLEISVEVDQETAEAVAEVLSRYAPGGVAIGAGPEGWVQGPILVQAYLADDGELWEKKKDIEEALWHLGQIRPIPEPSFRRVPEEDWAGAWKERLRVLHIGEHIVVQPSWLDYEPRPDDVVIQLDPGMAFGTGLHPTTQGCLSALEEFLQPGAEVLDVGTGSGILAIAAAKMEAERVLAVDNDLGAVKVARDNSLSNDVKDRVQVGLGSLAGITGSYDLVMVNILARVIVEMAEQGLAKRVRSGGILIAAGIIVDQSSSVVAALERGGLELIDQRQQGDWITLIAMRS